MLYAVLAIVAMIYTANLPLYISGGKDRKIQNFFVPLQIEIFDVMKYICFIFCLIWLSACSTNNSENKESEEYPVAVEEVIEYQDTSSYTPYVGTTTDEPTSKQSAEDLSPRAQAFQNAFNLGRQLGASDARNGERNCHTYAASYSDDWIKQQFIQGYEVGYNEVMAERSYEPNYVDDDDNYYYYEEDYEY